MQPDNGHILHSREAEGKALTGLQPGSIVELARLSRRALPGHFAPGGRRRRELDEFPPELLARVAGVAA